MVETINKETGEVVEEKRPDVPFRSLTDLKSYRDNEVYQPDTSKVDMTGYESLASIVARCTRVSRTANGSSVQFIDKTLLKAEEQTQGFYDIKEGMTVDEAFATADPTQDPDFDLVDASRISEEIAASVAARQKEVSITSGQAANSKASANATVETSGSKVNTEDEKTKLE